MYLRLRDSGGFDATPSLFETSEQHKGWITLIIGDGFMLSHSGADDSAHRAFDLLGRSRFLPLCLSREGKHCRKPSCCSGDSPLVKESSGGRI